MSQTPPSESKAAFAVTPQRELEGDMALLSVGQSCSKKSPDCGVVDFLPYKCDYCEDKFCEEHRFPESHNCEKYDANAVDRRALQCMSDVLISFWTDVDIVAINRSTML